MEEVETEVEVEIQCLVMVEVDRLDFKDLEEAE